MDLYGTYSGLSSSGAFLTQARGVAEIERLPLYHHNEVGFFDNVVFSFWVKSYLDLT